MSIMTEAASATTMGGTFNLLSAQEGREVYEGEVTGTVQQILKDNEGYEDREKQWEPSELAVTGMVAGIIDPVAASP